MERLVSIVRQPHRLVALVHRWVEIPGKNYPHLLATPTLELFETPVEEVSHELCPIRWILLEAWGALESAPLSAHTWDAFMFVLLHTVPDPRARPAGLRSLSPERESAPRATAAHPRAFRGTKVKPPKSKSAPTFDLRPYLADRLGVDFVRRALPEPSPEVFERLEKRGLEPVRLRLAAESSDLALGYLHPGSSDDKWDLPAFFRAHVEPALGGWSRAEVSALLDSAWTLGLEHDEPLRLRVAAIASRTSSECRSVSRGWSLDAAGDKPPPYTSVSRVSPPVDEEPRVQRSATKSSQKQDLKRTSKKRLTDRDSTSSSGTMAWCRVGAAQSIERRLTFFSVVAEFPDLPKIGSSVIDEAMAELLAVDCADAVYIERLRTYLATLVLGLDRARDLLVGYRLANRYDPKYVPKPGPHPSTLDEDRVVSIWAIIESGADDPTFPVRVWERCTRLKGLAGALARVPFRRFDAEVGWGLLELLCSVVYHEGVDEKWAFICLDVDRLVANLEATPESHRLKYVADLRDHYWACEDREELERWIPSAHLASVRICRPPFDTWSRASRALLQFVEHLPPTAFEALLSLPDSCFKALEGQCSRSIVRVERVADGLCILLSRVPEFATRAFSRFPAKFCRVAEILGSASEPLGRLIVKQFETHPLVSLKVLEGSPQDACAMIAKHACGTTHPMSRRLQKHVRGESKLSASQVARDMALTADQMDLVRLEVLEQLVYAALSVGLGVDSSEPNVRHALEMIRFAEGNRRGLRKLLQALGRGRIEYRARHPATLDWLRNHPRIDPTMLRSGVRYRPEIDPWGAVSIEVETDPLEILKLGTYAQTCLAPGGLCAYSASAVVLDINKLVLYARKADGGVVGRQLVAISKSDRLVCFSPYPESASAALVRAFREYDLLLASAIGIEIESDDDYEIEFIIATDWWDDHIWTPDLAENVDV